MKRARYISFVLLLFDFVAVAVVFNLMLYIRLPGLSGHLVLEPLLGPGLALMCATYLIDGYKSRTDMLSVDYASQHGIALCGAMVATLLLTYVFIPEGYELQSSRLAIALSFLVLVPFTLGYRRVIYMRTLARRDEQSLVFLGDPASSEAFRAECRRMGMPQRIISAVVNEQSVAPFARTGEENQPRLFQDILDDIEQRRIKVEAIVLRETSRELPPPVSRRLVEFYFSGVPTYTLELFHQVYWQKIPLYRLNQTWLFQEGFQIAREPVFERIKRVSDIFLSSLGLVLAAPLIGAAALAIWFDDRGPIFFAQTRVGKNHQPFRLIKLRTMRVSNETGDRYTRPGDSRITRVGKLLRTTRLDEFPQLWNVLRGEMSLIGPRAEWDRLVADYEKDIPCYHFRHLVKPGITGWAQVNYPYGASIDDTLRKLEYDLYYIRHFSFRLDASIVLKTIHVMLFGKGR